MVAEAWARISLGLAAGEKGDFVLAKNLMEEGLTLFRQAGGRHTIAVPLSTLGLLAIWRGKPAEARPLLKEAIQLFYDVGIYWGFNYCLRSMAFVATAEGRHERAAKLFGAADTSAESVKKRSQPERHGDATLTNALFETASKLGKRKFEEIWSGGRAMSEEEALKFALEDED